MDKNLINKTISNHLGLIECDQWTSFIAGASMMMGKCGHQNCYPRNSPANFTDSLEAIDYAKGFLNERQKLIFGELAASEIRIHDDYYEGWDYVDCEKLYKLTSLTAAQQAKILLKIFNEYELAETIK